jgi:ABC-2 type transport system ATP-binding protein
MEEAFRVEKLQKSFTPSAFKKPKIVLQKMSFTVLKGRTTGFIGVNGSGKTTSLKCILGFIFPDSGEITFFRNEKLSENIRQQIGYLPERPYYYEFLTADEFLKFHWQLSGDGPGFEQRRQEVLEIVDLKNVQDKHLRSFSKGMLQRVGMAQALLRKPAILILDEPMSGLDPDGRILIKDIIKREKARGTTIFFSSHLLGDMDELCDDLVVIDQGEKIYQGTLIDFTKSGKVEESFRQLRSKLQRGEGA